MNLSLNNKKVLITGSSRGIGLAISEVFLQEGAKTYLVSRGSDDLYENEKRLQDIYGLEHVFASKCDCTNIESLKNLKFQVEDKWKELDIVIVNVGDGRCILDALPDDEQWQKTWNNNFESSLQLSLIHI